MNWDWNVTGEHILRKRRIKIEKKIEKIQLFIQKLAIARKFMIFSDHEFLSILQLFFEKLNIKALFSLTIMDKIFETNSILDCALAHYGKSSISIFFLIIFCQFWQDFHFGRKTEHWAIILFWDFFDIS